MRPVTFGPYRLDLDTGELFRSDVQVKVQPQPSKLLVMLVERAGELVTRDEIRRTVWGADTFVDFDQSVNFCIRQIRAALHDNADAPCYVETLPRRGYRFIAPVQGLRERPAAAPPIEVPPVPVAATGRRSRATVGYAAVLLIVATVALGIGAFKQSRAGTTRATCKANQQVELGRFFLDKRRKAETIKAIEHFEAALEEDPDCGSAYAGIADAYNQMAGVFVAGNPPTSVRLLAMRAATRAIQLDPSLAEGYTALGYTTLHELDWSQAEWALRRSIELNPKYTPGHLVYANYLAAQRRFGEAIAETRKALEIEPASLRVRQALAWMLYFDRQYDAAIRELRTIVEMDGTYAIARFHLGEALLVARRFDEAVPILQRVVDDTERAPAPLGLLAMAYSGNGQEEPARRILEDLEERSTSENVPLTAVLLAYIAVGDKARAIDMLERGYAERDNYEIWIDASPLMDSLRNEPRYQAVCRQVLLGAPSHARALLARNDSVARRATAPHH